MPGTAAPVPGCRGYAVRAGQPWRTAASAVRADKAVLLTPFLLFALCVTGGVVAVHYAASVSAETERTKAIGLLFTVSTVRSVARSSRARTRARRALPTTPSRAATQRRGQRTARGCAPPARRPPAPRPAVK
jgi:hypothetical protein